MFSIYTVCVLRLSRGIYISIYLEEVQFNEVCSERQSITYD
jgi:hypothetical protein